MELCRSCQFSADLRFTITFSACFPTEELQGQGCYSSCCGKTGFIVEDILIRVLKMHVLCPIYLLKQSVNLSQQYKKALSCHG